MPFWFWAFVCKQFTSCMVYYFYFLSVFVFVGMLLVGGQDSYWPMVPITFFMGCIFIYSKTCPFFFLFSFSLFLSFMGLMTSSYFCLLMEPSALLAVLHVYSLHWLFIALPIYGALKIFCKATNVVAWIPQIRFFLLGPSVLQS